MLVASLSELAATDSWQAVVATHSPVVASIPGAHILELDGEGFHETTWEDLEMVDDHRRFMDSPSHYLRHLTGN